MVSNKDLNKIYPKGSGNMNKALVKQGVKTGGKSLAREATGYLVPYVDAGWDMYSGRQKIKNGSPFIGAGQMALGGLEALLDTAALLAAPETGGASTLAERMAIRAARQGAKKVVGKAVRNFTKNKAVKTAANAGKWMKDNPRFYIGSTLAPEAMYYVPKIFNNDTPSSAQVENPNGESKQPNPGSANNYGQGGYGGYDVPLDSIGKFIQKATGASGATLPGNEPIQTNGVSNQQQTIQGSPESLKDLIDYYKEISEYNKPYQQALENYVNNYHNYRRDDFNMNRYLGGYNGLQNMMGKFNPSDDEARRIDLINKLGQVKSGNLSNLGEMIGNAKLAQRANLPYETALADEKFLKNIGSVLTANTNANARMYSADKNYNYRMFDSMLDNSIEYAKAQGNWAVARELAGLKAQNELQRAVLNNVGYAADPSLITNYAQQFGLPINNLIPTQQQISDETKMRTRY